MVFSVLRLFTNLVPSTRHTRFERTSYANYIRKRSLVQQNQNGKIMIKRNFSMILVIIAMILNILNFGYSNINIESLDFCLSFCSTIVLIGASVKIFIAEKKNRYD